MDALNELESFSYSGGAREEEAAPAEQPRKRPRPNAQQQAAELLAQAERELTSSKVEVADNLDANTMKRMILSVEKRINENMQLRMKYAEQPERFMDSELELYQELKALHCIAAAPELFPTFVKTKCAASLLGLLAHENMDISSDVVDLFHEMTDAEDASPEDLQVLVDVLLEMDAAPMLMSHMEKLNEANEDEAACIHSTLGIFESILEARRALSALALSRPSAALAHAARPSHAAGASFAAQRLTRGPKSRRTAGPSLACPPQGPVSAAPSPAGHHQPRRQQPRAERGWSYS